MDTIDGLISVLLNTTARIDERDDAGIDLGKYDDDRALNALLTIVLDPNVEPFINDACGESIARIWIKRNYFNLGTGEQGRNKLYVCCDAMLSAEI